MNQLFEKNIESLAKSNNNLANKIRNLEVKKDDFQLLKTKDESDFVLKINVDGSTKLINSLYNPIRESKIKIDKLDLDYYNFIAVMGIGCGYYIEEILERFNKVKKMMDQMKNLPESQRKMIEKQMPMSFDRMQKFMTGEPTTIEVTDVRVNEGIPEGIFASGNGP